MQLATRIIKSNALRALSAREALAEERNQATMRSRELQGSERQEALRSKSEADETDEIETGDLRDLEAINTIPRELGSRIKNK